MRTVEYVDSEQTYVNEFLVRPVSEEEKEGEKLESSEDCKRSIITMTCHTDLHR